MPNISKRKKIILSKVSPNKTYTVQEAFQLLKELPRVKFNESIDISVNLGIDSRKSEQAIRGALVLPKGTGKKVKVAAFTTSSHVAAAEKAGADIIGLDDLAEKIKAGEMNFDVIVATPDAMKVVGQLGQILGPRGLMPNPKEGTVTPDIATAIKNAKSGQVRYRADKAGIIHCSIGKVDFDVADLTANFEAIIQALKKAKPTTAKGVYLKKITVSSTMGPGLRIDLSGV